MQPQQQKIINSNNINKSRAVNKTLISTTNKNKTFREEPVFLDDSDSVKDKKEEKIEEAPKIPMKTRNQ